MIRILATGTLHTEPPSRTSANGNPYTTAKLRADDGKGGSVWCNLIAFGSEAERVATLKAGAPLSVSGRAEVSAWLDKQGEPKAGLSIVVDELVTLRGKPKRPQEGARRPAPRRQSPNPLPVEAEPAPFDDALDF